MTIEDQIKNLPSQFSWQPSVINKDQLQKSSTAIVAAMGGSHLGAHLYQCWQPKPEMSVHSDFRLPPYFGQPLVMSFSYSGRTAETLSAANEALDKNMPVFIAASDGPLLELAQAKALPHVEIGPKGLIPRLTIGYFFKILADYFGTTTDPIHSQEDKIAEEARKIAENLKDSLPVVMSSNRNYILPLNARAQLSETAHHPVFDLYLPEANHHQMAGIIEGAKKGVNLKVLFFADDEDSPELISSMARLSDFYRQNGVETTVINLAGENRLEKLISAIMMTNYIGLELGRLNNINTSEPSVIEEFKLGAK